MSEILQLGIMKENLGQLWREHRGQYLLVNLISRRVRQLQLGERAQALPSDGSRDPVKIAIQEILEDKLVIVERSSAKSQTALLETDDEDDNDVEFGDDDDDDEL